MSRLYFADASGGVEVAGAERHWLLHLATGPGVAAWDVTETARLDRCAEILAMVPEVEDGEFGANYLHRDLREAQAEDARFRAAYAAQLAPSPPAPAAESPERRRNQVCWMCEDRRTCTQVAGRWECDPCQAVTP